MVIQTQFIFFFNKCLIGSRETARSILSGFLNGRPVSAKMAETIQFLRCGIRLIRETEENGRQRD
jgi:hypothetical protein